MGANPTVSDRDPNRPGEDVADPGDGDDRAGQPDGSRYDDRIVVDCLGATLTVEAGGTLTSVALRRAGQVARKLDGELRRHRATLAETGRVESVHLARLLERAGELHRRTDGAFDVRERAGAVRAFLDGDAGPSPGFDRHLPGGQAGVAVADVPLALGHLPLGYAVDRVAATLAGSDRPGRVDAGRIATDGRGLAIGLPGGESFGEIAGDWSLATTGTVRRGEGIDVADGDVVALARRDCTEAAALRSTLRERPRSAALRIAAGWEGGAALVVRSGVVRTAGGFDDHLE